MNKHKDRHIENLLYRQRIAKRGLIITTFLMPVVLIPEVKQYIKTRSQELVAKR
jgi:hypothetical protein